MSDEADWNDVELWTIGHSTRSEDEFLALLRASEIALLVDVRRFPGSRKYPHFNSDALRAALAEAGIGYEWLPALGGRRRPRRDSSNRAWRNPSFRGYADYMESTEFQEALAQLAAMARSGRTAVMCSEAVWWRCHRSMIADAFKARGAVVKHILGPGKTPLHPYTEPARLAGGELSYAHGESAREKDVADRERENGT